MLSNFHFLRPWWFLAIIPALILYICYKHKNSSNINNWQQYCDAHLLPHLLVGNSQSSQSWLPSFIFSIWLIVIIGLAGPTWEQYAQSIYQKNAPRVIALDVSSSMNSSDIVPSRLERAKYKVLDILKQLKEGQTGMIVFSSSPFVVSPLSNDTNTIASMVPVIDSSIVPVQGVDIAKALRKSSDLLKQTGFNHGQIILITDSSPTSEDIDEAKKLANEGYSISVLGIGTAKGGPVSNASGGFATDKNGNVIFAKLDSNGLSNIAKEGNGSYVAFSNDDSDVEELVNIANNVSIKADKSLAHEETKSLWKDEGHWLIWLSIILMIFVARKGWLDKLC